MKKKFENTVSYWDGRATLLNLLDQRLFEKMSRWEAVSENNPDAWTMTPDSISSQTVRMVGVANTVENKDNLCRACHRLAREFSKPARTDKRQVSA